MSDFTLYSTVGCHLCERAQELLYAALGGVRWTEVDIADDEQLMERYGVRIPVVRDATSGREIGWPFDARELREWIETLPPV